MRSKICILLLPLLAIFFSCEATSKDSASQFWDWFKTNQAKYYVENIDEKLLDELSIQLHKVSPDITFEFSPIQPDGIRELTISADGIQSAFPTVQYLVSKAPKIKKWQFNAFRQRIPGDSMSIQFNGLDISYQDIYFRYSKNSDKIDIELNVRGYNGASEYKAAIYILLDGLIGEYDMETQIAGIDFVLLDDKQTGELSAITKLRNVVDDNKKH